MGPVSGPSAAADSLLALVDLLGDPAATKAKLTELREVEQRALKAQEKAKADAAAARAAEDAAAGRVKTAEGAERHAEEVIAQQRRLLETVQRKQKEFDEQQAAGERYALEASARFDERVNEVNAREASLLERQGAAELAVREREAMAAARLAEADAAQRAAEAKRLEYETKLADLRRAVA